MKASRTSVPAAEIAAADVTVQHIPLDGSQLGRLSAALEDAFTLDGLRQLLRIGLGDGLSLALDSVVPVQGRTLHDIASDLVLWALRDECVGLQGLLAAALRANPDNPQLVALQKEWAGVTFTAPACPYPGMKPFTAAEQGSFYGRAAEIQQAVDRLRRHPFLAVVGPSGSGKSSLVAAGILPALETSHHFADKRWDVRTMRPGLRRTTPWSTCSTWAQRLRRPRLVTVTVRQRGRTKSGQVQWQAAACCWWWTSTRSCSPRPALSNAPVSSRRCCSCYKRLAPT